MDKREQILIAALNLFVEFGFHGTPTSKIAKEAGVANGTLFHYFPTKEDLIIALYTDIKERMGCYIIENTTDEINLKETLKKQFLASMYWALEYKAEFHFVEQFNSSPFLSHVALEVVEKYMKPFMVRLNKGIEDKVIKPMPVDLLFTLISSQIYGLNNYLVANKFSNAKQHQIINDTYELLWDMIS